MAGLGQSIRIANAYVQLGIRGDKQMLAGMRKFAARANEIGKTASVAGAAITGAGLAGIYAFNAAVQSASDLNETINKVREVFPTTSRQIEAFAKQGATALGASENATASYAAELGLIIEKIGQTEEVTANMSIQLVQLATDLASFNNTDVATAFDKLKSGLVGEAKPLRPFGILLSEVAVNAELAALGLEKVGGQFTEGEKVLGRYRIIMNQASAAVGDFERTSDRLANQQRIIVAQFENIRARIGQALLPVWEDLSRTLIRDVLPAVEDFINQNQTLVRDIFNAVAAWTAFGAVLTGGGLALITLGQAAQALTNILSISGRVLEFHRKTMFGATKAAIAYSVAMYAVNAALAAYIGYRLGAYISGNTKAQEKLNDEAERELELKRQINELEDLRASRVVRTTAKELELQQEKIDKLEEELEIRRAGLKEYDQSGTLFKIGTAVQLGTDFEERLEREIAALEAESKQEKEILATLLAKARGRKTAAQAAQEEADISAEQEKIQERQRESLQDEIKDLRIKVALLEQGEEAAQRLSDAQEFGADANLDELNNLRERIRQAETLAEAEEERAEKIQQIEDSYQNQLQQLTEQNILLTQGTEAAADYRAQLEGFDDAQRRNLARWRQANEFLEEQKDLIEEQRREAERAEDRRIREAERLQESFEKQLQTLKLQTLELTKGEEAAARARDAAAGFTPAQRQRLIQAREELRKAREDARVKEDLAKSVEKGIRRAQGTQSFGTVGDFSAYNFGQRFAVGEQRLPSRKEVMTVIQQIRKELRALNRQGGQRNQREREELQQRLKALNALLAVAKV